MIRDAPEVLPVLLENRNSTLAGKLAGAFRNIGRKRIADQSIETFKQADYDIHEVDPFEKNTKIKIPNKRAIPLYYSYSFALARNAKNCNSTFFTRSGNECGYSILIYKK